MSSQERRHCQSLLGSWRIWLGWPIQRVHANDQFRLRLSQSKPYTLQQALEHESIYPANKQRSKVVREIQLESIQVNKTHMEEGTSETL